MLFCSVVCKVILQNGKFLLFWVFFFLKQSFFPIIRILDCFINANDMSELKVHCNMKYIFLYSVKYM